MDNTTIIVVLIDDNSDEVINVAESHLKELEIVGKRWSNLLRD